MDGHEGINLLSHEVECPYCNKLTTHRTPAATINFAKLKCKHCKQEFIVVEGESKK